MHPELKEQFNKLYLKIANANPHMEHTELLHYTKMILDSVLKADTELFKLQYMEDYDGSK